MSIAGDIPASGLSTDCIAKTWEEYLQVLERKQRHELKRKWKKSSRSRRYRLSVCNPSKYQSQCLTLLNSIDNQVRVSEFWDPYHQTFFWATSPSARHSKSTKTIFLSVASHPKPIAAMLVFDYDNHYDLYNSGFNPEFGHLSPGQVLTSYTIKHAIEQGENYIFLRGDEIYKLRLGGQPQPIFWSGIWAIKLRQCYFEPEPPFFPRRTRDDWPVDVINWPNFQGRFFFCVWRRLGKTQSVVNQETTTGGWDSADSPPT